MPGQMTKEERERAMAQFERDNKNPVAAVEREKERAANAKEMTAGKGEGLQLPWSQRRKGEIK